METKFSYSIVGLFVIIFTLTFFIVGIWLSVGLSSKAYNKYLVYMNESVSGLALKAPVKYSGVDVGYVAAIKLSTSDPSKVRVLLNIEQSVPITVGTKAVLDSQGLTGIAYIELTGGKKNEPLLVAESGHRYPIIPSEPSLMFRLDSVLDHLSDNVDKITNGIKQIFDTENSQNLRQTLANTRQITQDLNQQSNQFKQIINDVQVTFHNTAMVSDQLPEVFSDLKQATHTFNSVSVDVKNASVAANATFSNSEVMIENVNQQIIPGFLEALNKVQDILKSVEDLSNQLDQNPSLIIRGTVPPSPGPGER